MSVKSTYNFVPAPLQEDVFCPDWAKQVSHDIPFSDGESGEIELKITAETPIFIRNGHSKKDAAIFEKYRNGNLNLASEEEKIAYERYLSFSNLNGDYFIPGTSLKGMFRNVLEIISSSRLNKKMVGNIRYSFRDLTQNSLYMNTYKSNNVRAGWLTQDSQGDWKICECDYFYHIHHEEVDNALGTLFRREFLNKSPNDKTAKYKYLKVPKGKSLKIEFKLATDSDGKTKAIYDKEGQLCGSIVFTGQSSKRKEEAGSKPSGKVHEFVFSDNSTDPICVSKRQQEDFKFIYLDHDRVNISKDWKFWREKLDEGERVPVFYIKEGDKILKHFGLAFMYKLPYEHSIHDMSPIEGYNSKLDLAETMFGNIEKEDSLKGRVYFGNAFSQNAELLNDVKAILSSPKASFFPFYLEQPTKKDGSYITYQNNGTLRGFKRYPVRSDVYKRVYSDKQNEKPKVFSLFRPLNKGAVFSMKIRFHNLRKIEIGALLSSITFHDNKSCFHSLGGAKPYGYGKVKIDIESIKDLKFCCEDYMLEFENAIGENKIKSRLKELLSMSSNQKEETLEYPLLSSKIDDFKSYKKNNLYLEPFSTINNFDVNSISKKVKQKKEKDQELAEEIARIQAKEREEQLAKSLYNSTDITALEEFIKVYPANPNIHLFRNKIEELRQKIKREKVSEMQEIDLAILLKMDFNKDKETLNRMLKSNKYFFFSDKQKSTIIENLKLIWNKDQQSFFKKRNLAKFTEYPWTDIKKWLEEDKAQELYNELMG